MLLGFLYSPPPNFRFSYGLEKKNTYRKGHKFICIGYCQVLPLSINFTSLMMGWCLRWAIAWLVFFWQAIKYTICIVYCHEILESSKYRYHLPHMTGNSISHCIPSLSHLYNISNLSLYLLSLVDIECGEQNKDEELNPSKCQKNEKEKKVEATSTTLRKLVDSKRKKKNFNEENNGSCFQTVQ